MHRKREVTGAALDKEWVRERLCKLGGVKRVPVTQFVRSIDKWARRRWTKWVISSDCLAFCADDIWSPWGGNGLKIEEDGSSRRDRRSIVLNRKMSRVMLFSWRRRRSDPAMWTERAAWERMRSCKFAWATNLRLVGSYYTWNVDFTCACRGKSERHA